MQIELVDDEKESTPEPTRCASTGKILKSAVSGINQQGSVAFYTFWDSTGKLFQNVLVTAKVLDCIFDLDNENDENYFGLSLPALIISIILSIVTTICAMHAHYILNSSANESKKMHNYPIADDAIDTETHKKIRLTAWQKFTLWGDWLSHVGDQTAPGLFFFSLNPSSSKSGQRQELFFSVACGFLSAIAVSRTCWDHMRKHNKYKAIPQEITFAMQLAVSTRFFQFLEEEHSNSPTKLRTLKKIRDGIETAIEEHKTIPNRRAHSMFRDYYYQHDDTQVTTNGHTSLNTPK